MDRRYLRSRCPALAPAGLALLLAACSAPTSPSTAPVTGGDSGPVQPKVNRVVVAAEPPGIEGSETRNLSTFNLWQVRPMYEQLVGNDAETGKNVPGLLTAWSLEPNGQSYRLKLRQGVKFHGDNGEFTVKDITTAWSETSREDSLGGQNAVSRPFIRDWERVTDHELLLNLKTPSPQVLPAVGNLQIFSSADLEKRGPGTMTTAPSAGTGLYRFATRTQGQFVRFERNPNPHWTGKTPDFPELEIRFIKEASTRLASLLTGEAHVTDLPEDLRKEAMAKGEFKAIPALASITRVLIQPHGVYYKDLANLDGGMKFPDSPMADARFRRALSKAINRDELNKAFFGGKGKVNVRSHHHPSWYGWNPEWEKRFQDQYGYDPAAARRLLSEAGFGPGKPAHTTILMLQEAGLPNSGDILEAVAGYWRAVGIDVKLEPMEGTQATQRYRNADFDNHIRIRGSAGDQWTGTTSYDAGTKTTRSGGVAIPTADKILNQALETLDEKKLDDLMRQAANIWFDQNVDVPLFWLSPEVMVNSKIVGGYAFPGNVSGGWTHLENLKAAR